MAVPSRTALLRRDALLRVGDRNDHEPDRIIFSFPGEDTESSGGLAAEDCK